MELVYCLVGFLILAVLLFMVLFIMGIGINRDWELDDEMQMLAIKNQQKKKREKRNKEENSRKVD